MLSLPDGRLGTRARVAGAAAIYAAAFVVGVTVASGPNEVSVALGATAWAVVTAVTLPAAHRRYLASAGLVRQRLQWLGSGATAAGEIALATGSLYVLVHWPTHAGAIAALGTAAIPIAMAASTNPGIAQRIDRVLFHTVSLVGVTFVVIAVYVVIVLGLGPSPTSDEHALLGLSMIAAAVATIAYRPARERLNDVANRLVYGERSAPDEALRSFGQRLTRAMPMEELLLQLAESLRKTMTLTSAEIWTGGGDVLERAVSVPDAGPARLVIGERERSVVARAGVSGNAWISVWLPALLAGTAKLTLLGTFPEESVVVVPLRVSAPPSYVAVIALLAG